jgi:hypothetical protein
LIVGFTVVMRDAILAPHPSLNAGPGLLRAGIQTCKMKLRMESVSAIKMDRDSHSARTKSEERQHG